jgi:hypothetical protein
MPALYRDDLSPTEHQTLLPKSEKHVSFSPDLQCYDIENIRSERKKRVIRRLHIFGLLALFLALLGFSQARRVSVLIQSPTQL